MNKIVLFEDECMVMRIYDVTILHLEIMKRWPKAYFKQTCNARLYWKDKESCEIGEQPVAVIL